MIRKFDYTVKGVLNPIASIVHEAIDLDNARNRGNRLVTRRICTVSELDDYVNRANAAWEAVCRSFDDHPETPIELEVSSLAQELGRYQKCEPYIQVRGYGMTYRVAIPELAENVEVLEKKFGTFYQNEDIRDVVKKWVYGDYTGTIEPTQKTTQKPVMEDKTMITQQETDLFVVAEGKVWSVDDGTFAESESVSKLKKPYVFCYEKSNYNNGMLRFERETATAITVYEFFGSGLEAIELCSLEKVTLETLCKLENLYREGRSNLPDAVFDHIMETLGVSEEKLQSLCGARPNISPNVDMSAKEAPDYYPAESKILSQEKVRDLNVLENTVKQWCGKAVVSWKYDGCAVRLHYRGRNLVRAESKGKARDVTALMKHIKGFPETINHGLPIIEESFRNQEWFVTGEVVAKNNRRSVAAGYLLRKDADSEKTVDIARELKFFAYDSNICEFRSDNKLCAPFRLYSQMMTFLRIECGFNTVELCEFKGREQFEPCFNDIPIPEEYDVDGLVVRLNDVSKYASFGETSHHPKGSVAFKFEDVWYRVKPKRIYGKRGSNNVVKLVAEFKPITIDGKKVSSATWQPTDEGSFELKYDANFWYRTDTDVGWYQVWTGGVHKEPFEPEEIEVCLRGKVIPQWRPIGE